MERSDAQFSEGWFRQAQEIYLSQFDQRLARLRLLNQRASEGTSTASELEELYRAFHHLAGSGATYGFPQISDTARPVCELLRPLRGSSRLSPVVTEEIRLAIEALDVLLDELLRLVRNPDP